MGERSEERERRVRRGLLVLAALVFVALRLPYLSLPLDRDEGEYAYIAWRMLEGDVPYRDAFDQKPPAVFAAYLAAFVLLGRSVEAIHGFALLWSAAPAWLLYAVVRRLAGGLAGAFAVLVFAAIGAHPALGATAANTELFLLLPAVASFFCLLRGLEHERPAWWLLCGVLAAAACWFKQVAATNLLFVVAVAALAPLPAGRRRAAGAALRLLWLGLGGLAVALPVFAWFVVADALEPFLDAVFLHNLAYAQRRSLSQGFDNLVWNLVRQAPALALAWLLALLACLRSAAGDGRTRALLGGWLVFSLLGVGIGLQFRPHYFVQALPALCALAGLSLAGLARRALALDSIVARGLALAGLLLAVLLPPVLAQRESLFASSPEAASRALYGLNPFPEARAIARHIAATSAPEDRIFVVGSEPQILFHAERRSATRYIFFYPLTGGGPGAAARQREAMEEVLAAKPRYVVSVEVPTSLLVSDATDPWIFEATAELLASGYALELLARPDDDRGGYQLLHGAEARRWLRRQPEQGSVPRVAVYRRIH